MGFLDKKIEYKKVILILFLLLTGEISVLLYCLQSATEKELVKIDFITDKNEIFYVAVMKPEGVNSGSNYNWNEDNNANVPVAVEFKNLSEKTIVGKDNQLIYPNTTFYLVGTLKPNENTTQRYSTDANSPVIKKAFVQDYVTTANFTVKSFQNAYNYLPDLRVPHLEIGLSVDLQWKTGITFPISID